jgi:hypothetical protein
LFAGSINPNRLVPELERYFGTSIVPGGTLIIFDEIQMSNRALTSDKAVFAAQIENSFMNNIPLPHQLHESMLELYREYLIVGGMPQSVRHYLNRESALSYKEIQRIIVDTYISDMVKYADKAQSIKTISTYESIVPQLAKDSTRSYSLNVYIKKYKPDYAIRVSGKNFGFEGGIKSVPLYAAYLI